MSRKNMGSCRKANKKALKAALLASTFASVFALTIPAYADRSGGVDLPSPITGTYQNGSADNGGAIYQTIETAIENAVFSQNTATGQGGAVNIKDSNATMSSVSFEGNSAFEGGAMFISAENENTISISDSIFQNNSLITDSTDVGGAISLRRGTLNIDNTEFKNNSAAYSGAIFTYSSGNSLNITNSLFEDNTALGAGAVQAMYTTNISDTTFKGNTANEDEDGGGALYIGAVANAQITGGVFHENLSATRGGAISTRGANANNSAAKLDILNGTFTNNIASTTGGAIDNYLYGSNTVDGSVTVKDSTFVKNMATNGGAIYNHGEVDSAGKSGNMQISDSNFADNIATADGGAIYNAGTMTLAGENTFGDNQANGVANDIYNSGTLNLVGTTNIGGGISGNGTINLGAESITNMYGEEVNGTSTIQANIINVTDGAKLALDWGDTINAATISGGALKITDLYVDGTKLVDEGKVDLFTGDAVGTIDTSSIGIFGADGKFTVALGTGEDAKKLVLAKGTGGGLAAAVEDNGAETLYSFSGAVTEDMSSASEEGVDAGNLNIIGDASTTNSITLENKGIGVASGHHLNLENADLTSGTGVDNAIDVKSGASAEFSNASADKIANAGTIDMEFTADKDISTVLTGAGTLNVDVESGKTVTWDTSNDLTQGTLNFTGDGHINLQGGTITADINNYMTGDSLQIDGVDVAGDVINTVSGHMVWTDGTALTGTLTNDGLFDIQNGTFTLTTNIDDAAADGTLGTLNIGDTTNTATVDASTYSIAQNQINILDKGELKINASNITTQNNISNAGKLELTGGTISNSVTGDSGVTYINSTGTVDFADTTTQIKQEIIVDSGTLKLNGANIDQSTADINHISLADGTTLELTGGTLTTGIWRNGTKAGNLNVTGNATLSNVETSFYNTVNNLTVGSGVTLTNSGSSTPGIMVENDLSNSGTITNANGVDLSFTKNGDVSNAGAINGAGSVTIGNGINATVLTNTGSITGNDIVISENAQLITDADKISDKDNSVQNDGTLSLHGGAAADSAKSTQYKIVSSSGYKGITNILDGFVTTGDDMNIRQSELNIAAGATLTNSKGASGTRLNVQNITVGAGSTLDNQGRIAKSDSGANNKVTVAATGHLINGNETDGYDASKVKIEADIDNAGVVDNYSRISSDSIVTNNGSLNNKETGRIGADINNYGNINNEGTITDDGDVNNYAGGVINNTGTIASAILNADATSILNTTASGITGSVTSDGVINLNDGSAHDKGTLGIAIANGTAETGVLNVVSGDITASQNITQKSVTVASTASLTIDADLLSTADGVTNDGTLELTGGTTDSYVDSANAVSGAGKTIISGYVNQEAGKAIESTSTDADALSITGGLKIAADDLGANTTNDGELELASGTLAKNIVGTGSTNIGDGTTPANVTNNALITQADVYVKAGSTLTTSGVDDTTTPTTGLNAETILKEGTTLNLTGGTVVKNINSYYGETGGDINVTGNVTVDSAAGMSANSLNVSSGNKLTNEGDITICGTGDAISGDIENNGDFDISSTGATSSTADITGTGTFTVGVSTGSNPTFTNNGSITGNDIEVWGGKLITNADNVSDKDNSIDVYTNGTLELTGGTLNDSVAGTGVVDFSGDTIIKSTIEAGDSDLKVVIESGKKIDIQSGGDVTLDGGSDLSRVDWQGNVELNGGSLVLKNIVDVTRDTGSGHNKTGVLTANTGNLTIDSGSVLLGDTDTIADAVVFTLQNANLTIGDDGDETASVYVGTDDTWNGVINLVDSGTLTLDGTTTATGTNSVNALGGTLILDDTTTYGSGNGVTLGSVSDHIDYAVATAVNADLTINAGQVQLDDSNDTLASGKILTLGGGQLDLTGISTTNNQLIANTGALNIQGSGKTTTLDNATGDLIAKAVVTTIDAGSTLKINNDNADVTLDGTDDTWGGALELNAGALTLDGRTDNLTGSTKTYNQDGGTLTLLDSSLTLASSDSAITDGNVDLTGSTAGSQLTFDNGLATNAAVITSDANTNNALTVGGTNDTTLTLNSGSDINAETAVTVNANSTLNAKGDSIKGGGSKGITNDGTFNLTNDGATAGTIARAIDNSAGDGSTGTVNLTGTTESTSAGTINQANVNVGDGTGATDSSTFTMGADVTANTLLKVDKDGKIVNAASDIVAEQINVIAGASIVGDGSTEGNLTVNNGGTNAGTISQEDVTLTAGTMNNTGTLTSNGTFTNSATVTGDGGILNVNDGSSTGTITQGNITVAGDFDNDANMEAKTLLNVLSTATLDNDATITAAKLTNDGVITQTAGTGNLNISGTGSYNSNSITQDNIEVKAGDFTNKTGADLMATTKFANDAGATFVNQGNVGASGSPVPTVQNEGTFTNESTGTVLATLLDNKTGGTFTNDGAVGTTADPVGTILNNGTVFTNNAGGTVVANAITNNTDMENKLGGDIDSVDFTNNSTLTNNGTIDSTGTFTNAAAGTVSNGGTEGEGVLNVFDGTNAGTITQGNMTIAAGNTGFDNNNTMTVETKLDNQGTFNNNKDVIVQNSTNNAELANTGTLNSTANSTINTDKLTNTGGTMNLTKSTVAVYYQADDIKGIINVLGTDASVDKTDLTVTGTKPDFAGTMNVGDTTNPAVKSTLNLKSGNILEEAALNVAAGNVLNVDDTGAAGTSSAVVDGTNDKYLGDITLASGDVTMKDLTVTTGNTSTTAGGTLPFYSQTGGALELTNSTMSMQNSSLISGGDLTVDSKSVFNSLSNSFTVDNLTNAGLINAVNNGYENYAVNNGLFAGDGVGDNQGDFKVDVYGRNNYTKFYDTFGSNTTTIYATNGTEGVLNVDDWAIHGDLFGADAPIDRYILLPNLFKGSVAAGQNVRFTATNKEVSTPIGNYRLVSLGGGNYALGLTSMNPHVYRGQVTTMAQYQNQLMIDDMIFNHTMLDQGFKGNDYLSSHPNYYASANDLYAPYQYSKKDGGLWLKMYGTFERLNMNQGLDVGNNAYGAIIGADFGTKDLKHGWQFMPTAYIAYNGAHQYWNGLGAYQNGGQIGFLGTFYKKNFMIGAMAYGGVYGNRMSTPRGSDDTFNYFAGTSVKAAYNWRFAKDWSLQPNLLIAYNFFGKQNWHTDYGQMGMMAGMLHGINIAPGINLIWEKETFSIYATLQYMYNVNQSLGGRAGGVNIPHVHMDRGYIQYGLGVNKRFTDKFSGYLQAVFRNVGRTGVSLQMGFQWALGQKGDPIKAAKTPKTEKTKIDLKGTK